MPRKFDESKRKRHNTWLIGHKINQGREPWNKGKTGVYSEETQAEMNRNRTSTKGRKKPASFSEKLSIRRKNAVASKETRDKMSKARKGKSFSPDHAEKARKHLSLYNGKKGEESNFWKGGITKTSLMIKVSDKYKKWRTEVFERDGYLCQHCGETKTLEVHHIVCFSSFMNELTKIDKDNLYELAMNDERLWDVNNGLTLCRECHAKTDNYLIKAKQLKIA